MQTASWWEAGCAVKPVYQLGYRLDDQGIRFWCSAKARYFSSFTTARLALWPSQTSIWWVPGTLPLEAKQQECDADHPPPSSVEVNATPMQLEGMVLNYFSPRTAFPWPHPRLSTYNCVRILVHILHSILLLWFSTETMQILLRHS